MDVRKCTICGREFTPRVWSQKTCSPECSKKMKNQKSRLRRSGYAAPKNTKRGSTDSFSGCKRKDCYYAAYLGDGKTNYCNYTVIEGYSKGCRAADCNKYRKRKPGEKRPKDQIYVG